MQNWSNVMCKPKHCYWLFKRLETTLPKGARPKKRDCSGGTQGWSYLIHSKFVSRDYKLIEHRVGMWGGKKKSMCQPLPPFLQVVKLSVKPLALYELKAPWMGCWAWRDREPGCSPHTLPLAFTWHEVWWAVGTKKYSLNGILKNPHTSTVEEICEGGRLQKDAGEGWQTSQRNYEQSLRPITRECAHETRKSLFSFLIWL